MYSLVSYTALDTRSFEGSLEIARKFRLSSGVRDPFFIYIKTLCRSSETEQIPAAAILPEMVGILEPRWRQRRRWRVGGMPSRYPSPDRSRSQKGPMAMPIWRSAPSKRLGRGKRFFPARNSDCATVLEHHAIGRQTVTHADRQQRPSSSFFADRHRGKPARSLAVFSAA